MTGETGVGGKVDLLRFLLTTKRHGSAASREALSGAEAHHSLTLIPEADEWRHHDNVVSSDS
jgi:hypothetical protein